MMKFRLALVFGLLVAVCLINTTSAEEGKAEPESEPESEPEAGDGDSKHAGSSVNEKTKGNDKINHVDKKFLYKINSI